MFVGKLTSKQRGKKNCALSGALNKILFIKIKISVLLSIQGLSYEVINESKYFFLNCTKIMKVISSELSAIF